MAFTRLEAPVQSAGTRPPGDYVRVTMKKSSKGTAVLLSVRAADLAECFRLKSPQTTDFAIELGEGDDAGAMKLICDAGAPFNGKPFKSSLVFRLGNLPQFEGKEGSAWCPYRFIKPYTFLIELPDWAL